jgi:N-formylglutamate amidohydrolase
MRAGLRGLFVDRLSRLLHDDAVRRDARATIRTIALSMDLFQLIVGEGPLLASAIHAGHAIRPEVAGHLALDEATRLREEDPYTNELAQLAPTYLVGRRSRFEFDINRPRGQCVYLEPADAWGLQVWRGALPAEVIASSVSHYDLFYAMAKSLLTALVRRHGRVVVLDLHSYNHRRDGLYGAPASNAENPEINVGTGSLDRAVWGSLIDRLIAGLRGQNFMERHLDVRENVKFFGGHFPQWIHRRFPGQVCAIAVEFKKTFMDEWTGAIDPTHFAALKAALRATFPELLEELAKLNRIDPVPSP